VVIMPSKTGMYFNGRHWRLSTRSTCCASAAAFIDRIRLGLMVFKVRKVKDWKSIEHLTIREWLEPLCGKNAYRIVWQPLIENKFSVVADAVNAVWMWKSWCCAAARATPRAANSWPTSRAASAAWRRPWPTRSPATAARSATTRRSPA
jgi:protoporphyrinogen oxidase